MKFFVYFCLTLVLCFSLHAEFAAQTKAPAVNYALKFNNTNDKTITVTRPRVYTEKTETVSNAAPPTVFDLERQAFYLINEKRREKGLKPLEWNEKIAEIARLHSQDMANNNYFSHAARDGSNVNDRADRIGLSKWRAIGENIAYNRGYKQPIEFAVERWMQSPKHKENLLGEQWQESAVGIAVTPEGTYYLTQVFLLRK